MTTGKALNGKPYAGNPHVRFDEGEVASAAMPRRGSLLYNSVGKHWPLNLICAVGAAFGAMTSLASTLTVGEPSMDGNTFTLPVTVTGGGEVSFAFASAEPRESDPVANQVVSTQTAGDGDTLTFTQIVTLGKKVAYRLAVDGDSKSGTYEVPDTARYIWNTSGNGLWSDADRWSFETNPNDGLDRLGYPSYGSFFVFKGLANQSITVRIDGVYGPFATSRIGRADEKMSLTFKGIVDGATLKIDALDQEGCYVGNDLTLDNVTIPNIQKWVVRDNCTLSVINGGVLKTGWEFRVAKPGAKLYVGKDALVETTIREYYHRLGLAGDGAEIVIDDGTLVVNSNFQICNSDDGGVDTSPKGVTFKGTKPQMQIRGYAKDYQSTNGVPPTITFVIPENGYERVPIVKIGTESDHKFIDLATASQKINFTIDPESPFLSRTSYLSQTLVDWTYNGTSYSVATDNFTLGSDVVAFGPENKTGKSKILCSIGTKEPEPGIVSVSFDANGGTLEDDFRLVKTGGTYGENINLYSASSASDFVSLAGTIGDHVFTYSTSGRWWNFWSKPIDGIVVDKNYTYVVEVLSYANESASAPWFNIGQTGSDQPSQLNWASFQVQGTGKLVKSITGRSDMDCTTLGRDYLDFNHDDGGICTMTFRVSLFAGKGAVADDFTYAEPGEGAACPLPVPARTGFEFAGWVNSVGETVTTNTVVTAMGGESQTLTATWHRLPGTVIPVRLFFDGNGGSVGEAFRIVNTEQPYGRNVNLYTAEISTRGNGITNIADGVFYYVSNGQWCNYWSKTVQNVYPDKNYTYVLDVLTYNQISGDTPEFHIGWTDGDTYQSAQLGSAPNVKITGVGRYFSTMTGRTADIYRVLERAYIYDPGSCEMTFRVSLFAGVDVNASNYAPVAPGAGMTLPLPVATCKGKVFDHWEDADGNAVTDDTIVDADGDITIKAVWKPWTATVENGDRPKVGKALTISTNYGDGTREGETGTVAYRWYRADANGTYESEPIADGASYTPIESDTEHFLKGVVLIDGVETLENPIWISKLPVVYIDTADGADIVIKTDEKDATVRIQGNDEFKQQYSGAAKVKGRGNSTWGLPKKPYKMKLDKSTDLFGFGKNKHWVLLANYIDVSSMRNKTAYDMSGEFGLNYQASTWVEVVFNGRFDGTYQLCEHIRTGKTRVNVFDWEEESEDLGHTAEDLSWIDGDSSVDVTGGYIWELSAEYDDVSKFKIDVSGDGETDEDIPVMFNKPEYAYTSSRMMDWTTNFWQDVYASWTTRRNVATDGETSWTDLCDIDSMVSYWLVNEIFGNDDAWYKSRYCYKDIGGKLKFGPVWDFDWGLGSVAVGTNSVTSWRLAKNNNSGWPVSFYKQWLNDPAFCMKAYDKYWEMRPKFTALLADGGEYDRSVASLAEAGVAEDARWDAERTASYGANKRTQAGDAAIFKEWMTTRLAWLDEQFATLDGFIAAVQNDESVNKYTKRDDKLVITADGRYDSEKGEYRVFENHDLVLKVSIKCSAKKVDIMVNGRYVGQGAVTKYGANNEIVDEIRIPNETWRVDGSRTLVELVTLDADSGEAKYSNHIVVKPCNEFFIIVR